MEEDHNFFGKNNFYTLLWRGYVGQVSVNGSGFENLNIWMTIEVGFQNFKCLQCFHNTVQSASLEEIACHTLSLCGLSQTGTVTGVSEEFWLKTGIKGWHIEEPMWMPLQNSFSCLLLINFFMPQSCSYFYLSHSPHLLFSLAPHPCVSFSRFLLCSSGRFVLCGGTLQCSNHCWVVLLLLHGTVGGI